MILRSILATLVALLVAVATNTALADADADWQAGQQAFQAGDPGAALAYFESARDQGLAGPAVHYNIAVCQYELGDYAGAAATFRFIAEGFPGMRGLAEYNVGLAERKLGNSIAAQRYFIAAWQHSSDEKVRALAASQLGELEHERPRDWFGTVAINAGHDDNVALRDSLGLPAGVTAESPMADLFATLSTALPGDLGLTFDAGLYAVRYPDADEFDQTEIRLGGRHTLDTANWRLDSGLHFARGTLGGSSFNEELNVDLRATRYLDDNASFEGRLRYDEIRGARTAVEGIDGSRTRLDLRYRWYDGPHHLVLRAGVENNARRDAGVSPSRQRLQGSYYRQLTDAWELELTLTARRSDYDDIATPRREDLLSWAVGASWNIAGNWQLTTRYQYSDNDSSDPLFSYERNQLTVGVLYPF